MELSADTEGDTYRCTPMDPGLTQTGWITGLQLVPDVAEVVHHVVIFADPTGASEALAGPDGGYPCFGTAGVPEETVLFAWAPGSDPLRTPPGSGLALPAGGRLVMQIHYHPGRTDVSDRTRLDVQWADTQPELTAEMRVFGVIQSSDANTSALVEPPFAVPAGERNHVETLRYPVDVPAGADVRVWSVFSHMHLAGSDIKVTIDRATDDVCLAHNPTWDFNWQRTYVYDAPFGALPQARDGDVLEVRCTFDNTDANPVLMESLAEEGIVGPISFDAGEDTTDEMCVAIIGILY
jgi:hypothetical protein